MLADHFAFYGESAILLDGRLLAIDVALKPTKFGNVYGLENRSVFVRRYSLTYVPRGASRPPSFSFFF